MKLKKLLALAMSGVLAVSMLAGCNGNNAPVDDGTDPIEPGTSGVSAEVKSLVEAWKDAEIPSYVTFSDSAELNSDLQYAVEYAGVDSILPGYFTNKVDGVDYSDTINVRLRDAVEATGVVDGQTVSIWNIGDDIILQNAEDKDGHEIDDAVAVGLYAVSSAIGENAMKQMVAEQVGDAFYKYHYSIENTNGGNYNHEYTVSVSTYTKAVNSTGAGIIGTGIVAEDPAVTFIAVQVVRTSTHQ